MTACRRERGTEVGQARQPTQASAAPTVFEAVCATCHGPKGEGNKELMSPAIASLPRWYVEEQIQKFRNGQRGAHPADVHGQQMRAAISVLTDEQIAAAIDYLQALPAVRHEASLQGDPERGKAFYDEYCMACHRFNGHGELAFHSASLNGLQDWYLLEQINKFQQGIRGYHPDDEAGAKMRQAVSHLVTREQKLDVLAYLTELAGSYPVIKGEKQQTQDAKLQQP